METKQMVSGLVGMVVGLLLGALIITGWNATRYTGSDRAASDQCWVDGGDYRNGKCEQRIPGTKYDKFKDEGLVCDAMKGSYMIKGETFQCFDDRGEELKMPDLEGKTVDVTFDGTVVVSPES